LTLPVNGSTLGPGSSNVSKRGKAPTARKGLFLSMIILAVTAGLVIAWVDSRPTWDDAGITAGMLFLMAALFGALRPARAPVWALAVGVWVPLLGIVLHHNFGSLLALGVAFFGAYAGALARRALALPGTK
jgi:hypothetical protein